MTHATARPASEPATQPAPRNDALRLIGYWSVVTAWMLVISLLSTEPFSAANTSRYLDPVLRFFFPHLSHAGFLIAHTIIRKAAHLSEFFILGTLAFWAARHGRPQRWSVVWMGQALGLAVLYALLDEAHQAFVPNRTSSLVDSGIDSLGAAISQLCIYLRHRLPRRFAAR